MSEPSGLRCPGCEQPAVFALSGQAFCGNDNCGVFTWNPTMTLDELAQDVQQICLPSFTCRRCGLTSFHPQDVAQGYCGNCHDWTGKEV